MRIRCFLGVRFYEGKIKGSLRKGLVIQQSDIRFCLFVTRPVGLQIPVSLTQVAQSFSLMCFTNGLKGVSWHLQYVYKVLQGDGAQLFMELGVTNLSNTFSFAKLSVRFSHSHKEPGGRRSINRTMNSRLGF